MANDPIVVLSSYDGIATITLNRPDKRNAMNGTMIQALTHGLQSFASDKATRVVLLKANGEHFCAGADIAWMQQLAQANLEENIQDAMYLANLMYQVHTFPKPVIALTQGSTLGGGLGLVAACDIAIAATNASFTFSEVKLGIAPSIVSPYVVAAIGERMARYYFLTAEKFSAERAQQLGLIHQLTEPEALNSVGLSVAHALLQHSPSALSEVKRLIQRVSSSVITPALMQFSAEHLATTRTSVDAREGLEAFLEKRTPKWS